MSAARPWPTEIRVRAGRKSLQIAFDSGETYDIPAELLRVMTPAADERGHGGPAALTPLPIDKAGVAVADVTPVGRYAVRIAFDDGHDTGLYTWEALRGLGRDRAALEGEHARLLGR